MQDPVMGPAQAEIFQQMIGVADKIAISEEHEFDQVEQRLVGAGSSLALDMLLLQGARGAIAPEEPPSWKVSSPNQRPYGSIVDIFQENCYTSRSKRALKNLAEF